MKLREFIEDLKSNVKLLLNTNNFSRYHLLSFSVSKVEFLGKVLLCSDSAFNKRGNSKYSFFYAILKLQAFSEYEKFVMIKRRIGISDLADENDTGSYLSDGVNLLNRYANRPVKMDFYEDFRCSFDHAQRPTAKISYTSDTNLNIHEVNSKFRLDCLRFINDLCNACDEVLRSQDPTLCNYLNKEFLSISQ